MVNAMSKVGRQPIVVPDGVTVVVRGQRVEATGPRGSGRLDVPPAVTVTRDGGMLRVAPAPGRERARGVAALWGTSRAHVRNLVEGVEKGFEKRLALHGVGYRAEVHGGVLTLHVGFSHPVRLAVPDGITVSVEKNTIIVSGIDRHAVGEAAASIRRVRPPEPYKGKGIRVVGERVRRKVGKVVGGTEGPSGR